VLPVVGVAALIAGVGVEIGFFALVIPGIVLWIRLLVVPQAAAIERGGVRDALRNSWQLTREHGSHIFGLLLVFVILALGVVFGARAFDAGSSTSAGNVALGIAVNTIIASFTALATALLYFRPARSPRANTGCSRGCESGELRYSWIRRVGCRG
jgi:TRAP-type C4-dicarboxylate transport system permease large subunit